MLRWNDQPLKMLEQHGVWRLKAMVAIGGTGD